MTQAKTVRSRARTQQVARPRTDCWNRGRYCNRQRQPAQQQRGTCVSPLFVSPVLATRRIIHGRVASSVPIHNNVVRYMACHWLALLLLCPVGCHSDTVRLELYLSPPGRTYTPQVVGVDITRNIALSPSPSLQNLPSYITTTLALRRDRHFSFSFLRSSQTTRKPLGSQGTLTGVPEQTEIEMCNYIYVRPSQPLSSPTLFVLIPPPAEGNVLRAFRLPRRRVVPGVHPDAETLQSQHHRKRVLVRSLCALTPSFLLSLFFFFFPLWS